MTKLALKKSKPNNSEQLCSQSRTELKPAEIVSELDRYIIGQHDAKKAVAIALRNRWRRQQVAQPMRDEITPKNIIMIGPTGVGKTEISRRLAKLVNAPFVKVEATKFTEIGYVGRDVESIIRELADVAFHQVKDEARKIIREDADYLAEERLLDLLLSGTNASTNPAEQELDKELDEIKQLFGAKNKSRRLSNGHPLRQQMREMLRKGELDNRVVDLEINKQIQTHMQVLGPIGMGEIEGQIKEAFANMVPKQKEVRKLPVREARKVLIQESEDSLLNYEEIASEALRRAEQNGIVFIDEIDKIAGSDSSKGPDVSREGVQRDLLPLVEGCTVGTRYGPLRTEHVLFIASGAFHMSKPSDLMPEFQGRFPIRVELQSLTPKDFVRILTEPENALTRQYQALLETEGVKLKFAKDGVEEIAALTADVNAKTENIGARRLCTLLERLLEEISFSADSYNSKPISIDRAYVREKLKDIVSDQDLSRFIL